MNTVPIPWALCELKKVNFGAEVNFTTPYKTAFLFAINIKAYAKFLY